MHPVTRKIQAVHFKEERGFWRVLDEEVSEDFAAIRLLAVGMSLSIRERRRMMPGLSRKGRRRAYLLLSI